MREQRILGDSKMKHTLKTLREENKKTAAEVATVLGVSIQALYNYEAGNRRIGLEHVLAISKLYECSAEEVINAQLISCQNAR